MDALKLNELELRYFAELFSVCDVENAGKVSGSKAQEFFKTSQLSPEILHQVTEICGAKRLGHFGRNQFYVALKLIGAAQLGLPLKLETFHTGMDIPLPKFARINDGGIDKSWLLRQQSQPQLQTGLYQQYNAGDTNLIHLQERQENYNQIPGQLPPPPAKNQPRNSSNATNNQKPVTVFTEADKHAQIPTVAPLSRALSPSNNDAIFVAPAATRVDMSPPSNVVVSGTNKDWAAYVGNKSTPMQDGQQWQQFEDEKQLLTTEDENSERHSSDDEYDVWAITDEQREYYINQFRLLQPDIKGLISGSVAKEFFEKSKLPVQQLSKIWQLSDVNKDGALSLEEFFTAMHLVVLRRNNIELPEVLPPSLIPHIGKESESLTLNNSVGSSNKGANSPQKSPTEPTSPHSKEWTHFNDSPTSSVSSPGIKPVNFDFQKSAVEQDPKILHPVALRLSPESQVISSDESDPNKIPPLTDPIPYEPLQEQQKSPGKWPVGVAGGSMNAAVDAQGEFKLGPPPQAAIQRPIAKKHSVPGPGALPPPPQTGQLVSPTSDDASDGCFSFPASSFSGSSSAMSASYHIGMSISQGPKKEPPPPPPPRPKRNHARSSSLDLNRLANRNGSFSGPSTLLGAPPAVPPRMSPSTTTPKKLVGQKSESDVGSTIAENANFANFNQFTTTEPTANDGNGDAPLQKTGAFEVYKRPADASAVSASTVPSLTQLVKGAESAIMKEDGVTLVDFNSNEEGTKEKWSQQTPDVLPTTAQPTSKPRDKREIQISIRNHRERNMVLSRLNSELNQELSEVMEERIALEIQLEHMKPYSN